MLLLLLQRKLKDSGFDLTARLIQAPSLSRRSLFGRTPVAFASAASQDILTVHWQEIVKNIQLFLNLLVSNNVKYVKTGLSELEKGCYKATKEYASSAWDELKHIRQAIGFLAMHQKPKTLDKITHDMCLALSLQQQYKISSMYTDNTYNTFGLSPDVISELRLRAIEDSYKVVDSSFLLYDDDTSIPFTVDDLSKSMDQINVEDIEPPPLMRDYWGFSFLLLHAES
ncbi:myosin-11-like protein isoform X1 [Tanacetum coccineum]